MLQSNLFFIDFLMEKSILKKDLAVATQWQGQFILRVFTAAEAMLVAFMND